VLRTEDGEPVAIEVVSLLPGDLKPGETDRYFQSVGADPKRALRIR
jgi:hypothetical protein